MDGGSAGARHYLRPLTAHPQARFGVPYSICGCLLPEEKKLSTLMSKLSVKSKPAPAPSALLGALNSNDDADATHPSAHNSVYLVGHPNSEKARARREKERQEQLKREEKKYSKGQLNEKELARRRDHDSAFLYPVPMYVPIGGAACAAISGQHVSGDSASAGGGSCAVQVSVVVDLF